MILPLFVLIHIGLTSFSFADNDCSQSVTRALYSYPGIKNSPKVSSRWKHISSEDSYLKKKMRAEGEFVSGKMRQPPIWKEIGSLHKYLDGQIKVNPASPATATFSHGFYDYYPNLITEKFKRDSRISLYQYTNVLMKERQAGRIFSKIEEHNINNEILDRLSGVLIGEKTHFNAVGLGDTNLLQILPEGDGKLNRWVTKLQTVYGPEVRVVCWPDEMARLNNSEGAFWDSSRKLIIMDSSTLFDKNDLSPIIHESQHTQYSLSFPINTERAPFLGGMVKSSAGRSHSPWIGIYDQQFAFDEMPAYARGLKEQFKTLALGTNTNYLQNLKTEELIFPGILSQIRIAADITNRSKFAADQMLQRLEDKTLSYKLTSSAKVSGVNSAEVINNIDGHTYKTILPLAKASTDASENLVEKMGEQLKNLQTIAASYEAFYRYLQLAYDRLAKAKTETEMKSIALSISEVWLSPNRLEDANLKNFISRFNQSLSKK